MHHNDPPRSDPDSRSQSGMRSSGPSLYVDPRPLHAAPPSRPPSRILSTRLGISRPSSTPRERPGNGPGRQSSHHPVVWDGRRSNHRRDYLVRSRCRCASRPTTGCGDLGGRLARRSDSRRTPSPGSRQAPATRLLGPAGDDPLPRAFRRSHSVDHPRRHRLGASSHSAA